jgi:hypothetical protein
MKFLPVVFDLVSSHGGVVVGRQPGEKVSWDTCAKRKPQDSKGQRGTDSGSPIASGCAKIAWQPEI